MSTVVHGAYGRIPMEVPMSFSVRRIALLTGVGVICATPSAAQQTVQLPARDNLLRERPAEVFSVGTVEGRDWEMFSGIRSLAFDAADNLYVLDGQSTRVVVFDSRGRFVRQFATRGGGPGELQAPIAMAIAADGNVVVNDIGNRAFIVFRPDGEYVRNIPFNDELGFPVAMVTDPRGGIIARAPQRMSPDQDAAGTGVSPIFRVSLDDASTQTLYRVPVATPRVSGSTGSDGARRTAFISMDPIFGPRPAFAALPEAIALHYETEYAIRILDGTGRHIRTLTRDYTPKRVTKKDQEEFQKQRERAEAQGGGPMIVMSRTTPAGSSTSVGRGSGTMAFSADNMPFAEYMAVVTSIRSDPQGRIWVQRRATDGKAAGPIDLVTANGRYIGTLQPQAMPGAISASGLAAWVLTDDLGVERVVVRRLPGTWR
ncbi:MAG: 6-bladed beta-propeller [Gemmatimonadetes bacterium]|nr:6-bladed beta-propeller [Gemmatimonadota bacterium]